MDQSKFLLGWIDKLWFALKLDFAMWSHMSCLQILLSVLKYLFARYLVVIKIPFKSGRHTKVVDKQWVLVDMFKNAKLAFLQT